MQIKTLIRNEFISKSQFYNNNNNKRPLNRNTKSYGKLKEKKNEQKQTSAIEMLQSLLCFSLRFHANV